MKIMNQIKYSSFENPAQLLSVFDYFLTFDDCEMRVNGSMKDGEQVDFVFYLENGIPYIQTPGLRKFSFTRKSTLKLALNDLAEMFTLDTIEIQLEAKEE